MNIRLLFLLIGFCFGLQTWAESAKEIECYAEIIAHPSPLIAGDSCLVSVVLRANLPFHEVKKPLPILKFKGANARLLQENTRQQSQQRTSRGLYYEMVLQQYIVGRENAGKIVLPKQHYKVVLARYESPRQVHPFFYVEPQIVELVRLRATFPPHTILVQPRPKRSTQEMLQSGQSVI